MAKTISIDAAVISQVHIITDSIGALRIFCDYTLNSGPTVIQAFSEELTGELNGSGVNAASALFTSALAAVNAVQGVAATWPAAIAPAPAAVPPPQVESETNPTATPPAGG